MNLAGGKLSINVDVKVGTNELDALQKSMANRFKDIDINFKDSAIKAVTDKIEGLGKLANAPIKITLDNTKAIGQLEEIETKFKSLKQTMESFTLSGAKATQGNLGKGFMADINDMSTGLKKGMSAAEGDIKTITNNIQQSMKGLRSIGQADAMLSGLKESEVAVRSVTSATQKAAAQAKEFASQQSAAYKELETSVKSYYKALERMDKFQDRVDKNVATKADIGNLAEAKKQVEQLGSAIDKLETSFKTGDNQKFFDADLDKGVQNLKEMSQEARVMQQNINSAGNEAKQLESAYDELVKIQKQINQLNKQEANAGDEESAVIREQIGLLEKKSNAIREMNNLSQKSNSLREDEISDLKEMGSLERRRTDSKITDRANRPSSSKGQGYESMFGMDRIYGYIDVLDVMREGAQVVRQQFEEFRELDNALVDIRKVADATDNQWARFNDTLYDNASAVGKTATEYSKSVERWAAAGFDLQEATELGTLSTMGAFVGNIDEEAMVKYMSVPLNAFKESVDATDILNVMNEVSNNTAAEMNHLGEAYSRAAATAAQSGTSFEELTAILATTQETTRLGGEVIGTTWRTMDKNVAQIASQSTKGQQKSYDMFKEWGVDLLDANGELKSTYDVLKDISGIWDNLSSVEQTTAATAIGGARGLAMIQSLMANWGRVDEILGMAQGQVGLGDTGSAFKEFEIQKDSMEFKIAELKNTWQEFMNSLAGGDASGMFKDALEGAKGFVETLQSIAENESAVNTIKGIAEGLGVLLAIDFASSGIKKLFGSKGLLGGGALKSITSGFKEASKGATGFGGVMKGVGGSIMNGGWAAVPGKLALIYTGFKLLDGLLGGALSDGLRTAFDGLADSISRARDPLNYALKQTQSLKAELSEKLSANRLVSGEIQEAQNIINKYGEVALAKERAFAASGDMSSFTWSEEEFSSIQTDFNNMIDDLELSQDLKITWNNHDHIMSQMAAFKKELRDLTISEAISGLQTLGQYYANPLPVGSMRNQFLENNAGSDQITGNRASSRAEAEEFATRAAQADAEAARRNGQNYQEAYDKAYQERLAQGRKDFGKNTAAFIESSYLEGAISQRKTELNQLQQAEQAIFGGLRGLGAEDFGYAVTETFEHAQGMDGAREAFILTAHEAGRYREQIVSAQQAQTGLNKVLNDYIQTDGTIKQTKESAAAVKELSTQISELPADLQQEIGTITGGKYLGELNESQLRQVQTLLSSFEEQQNSNVEQIRSSLKALADDYDITDDQIDNLISAYGDKSKYAEALFDVSPGLALREMFGAQDTAIVELAASFDMDMSELGDVVVKAQQEVESMDLDIELAARLGITTDDGMISGDTMMGMFHLESLQDSYDVNLGFTLDGENDLAEYLDAISVSKETQDILVKAGVDVQDGLVDLESFNEVLGGLSETEREILIEAFLNDNGTYEQVQAEIKERESGVTTDEVIDRNVIVNTHIKEGDLAKEYLEGTIQEKLRQFDGEEIDMSFVANIFPEPGEVNLDALVDAVEIPDQRLEMMAEIGINITDGVDLTELTDYILHLQQQENGDRLILEFFMEILPEGFEIVGQEELTGDIEEELEDSVPDEVEGETQLNVETEAEVAETEITEEEIAGDVPTTVEKKIQIKLSTESISSNFDGLVGALGDRGITISTNADTGGIEEVQDALAELPPAEYVSVVAEATGTDEIHVIRDTIANMEGETRANFLMEVTGQDSVDKAYAQLASIMGENWTAEAVIHYLETGERPEPPTNESAIYEVENTESGNKPEPPTDEEATHTTYIEFAVTNPEAVAALDGQDISFTVTANINDNASAGIQSINSALESMPLTQSVSVTASTFGAMSQIALVKASLTMLGMMVVTPKINGDNSGFFAAAGEVSGWVPPSFTVRIGANTQPFRSAVAGLSSLVPSSLSTTINAKVSRSGSATIGADIGSSFSNSIGSALGSGSLYSQQINRSQSTTEEAKVNEDVWRYWAKEMYDGDELASSMDELTAAISRAGDDYAKIISLSRQQISLAKDQMRFEKEMAGLEQQQMNNVLSELRGYGFKTDGNKITNLDHAQNLSGDKATEAESALNTWKDLYKSISSLGGKISDLEGTIHGAEEAIEDAKLNLELEKLEKQLAKTELLLSSISNNLSILKDKDSFIGSEDYELKIRVSEENIDTSISNIQTLMDEFNKLSVKSLEFEENSEVLLGTLEDLADDILENADNILRFREQITQIRIDSLTDDFDRFSDAVDKNTDSVNRNIGLLKEGLMDAYGTDELSGIYTVDYTRKTALEKEYEDRLKLAESLDAALEAFTKKNIERTHSATQAQLQIAKSGYDELLKIQQGLHSNGIGDLSSYTGIGVTEVSNSDSDFSRRQLELLKHLEEYQAAYNDQIKQYEKELSAAATTRDREIAQYNMIIAQLSLQEEYQKKAIENYKSAISLAEAEIENGNLTTEQRRELQEFIDEYKEKITDAQDAIREAIGARFEYEFDMMDKAAAKAESYYDNISHLLDVGKMINLSPDAMKPFYDAMYKASSNQYALAEEQLKQLTTQQKEFTEGSYEWNLLAEQIDSVRESMKDLTIQSLESNQAILENTMDSLERMFEVGLLGGKTLSEWKDFNDEWVSGIEKEVTLEGLRQKALNAESQVIKDRLNMLDKQENVSKSDLDYLDKQLKVLELEDKLRNLENERNVQVLGRREDGTWGFDYVTDQTEYDKTKEELDDANIDLEKFITEQRTNYVERLGEIINKAKEGGYSDTSEIQSDLDLLNSIYGMVLSDIPGFTGMSFDEILSAYQEYLSKNDIITDGLVGSDIGSIDSTTTGTGLTPVQKELVEVTTQLGEIIGSELRSALGDASSNGFKGAQIYQIGELVLPNVTDGDGLVNIFNDLPKAAEQAIYDKSN